MLGCVLDSRQSVLDPRNTVNCLTYLEHTGCQPLFMGTFSPLFLSYLGLFSILSDLVEYTRFARVFHAFEDESFSTSYGLSFN